MSPTPQKYVYIRTFGCQMNEHDSARIFSLMAREGYAPTDTPDDADLIIFNTCTIREKAHHKAMSEIGRARLLKDSRPGMLVAVCGCVAQQERESLFVRYPHIDILFGPDQILKLPELIRSATASGCHTKALELINDPNAYQFIGLGSIDCGRTTRDARRTTAFVSVMKGCNCACSYCIVPSVRGREVHRRAGEIISEVEDLAKRGIKEVVLLGQNVNAYFSATTTFARLLRRISEETEIRRIRFTSPHPRDVGEDVVREYAENEKLMPHIHLPVQAGSNSTLRRMRRGYTRERFIEIADALRRARQGMAITTDIIVGFCGETDDEFEETVDLMQEVEFDSIFAFKYSPRPGTEAAKRLLDDVPQAIKTRRLEDVLSLQRRVSKRLNEALVGTAADILVTGLDRMNRGLLTGRRPDNRIVHFSGNPKLVGHIVPVRITDGNINSLKGEMIQ